MIASDSRYAADIAGLIGAARATGQPQKMTVDKWTRLKATWRDSGPAFLFWKITGTLPSKRNCEALALAAGIIAPVYKQWICEGTDGLFVSDRADHGHMCAHVWASPMFTDGKTFAGVGGKCSVCGVVKMTVSSRRGSKSGYEYDGLEVSQDAYARFVVSGPIPHALNPVERAAILAALVTREGPPWEIQPQTPQTDSGHGLKGRVCGLCEFGDVSEFLDVECSLGWGEHDPLMFVSVKDVSRPAKANGKIHYIDARVQFPHGLAALPILAPQTRCMCRESQFKPYRGAPGPNRERMFADRAARVARGHV